MTSVLSRLTGHNEMLQKYKVDQDSNFLFNEYACTIVHSEVSRLRSWTRITFTVDISVTVNRVVENEWHAIQFLLAV